MKQLISYYRMPGDREEEILRLIHAEGLDGVENLIYGSQAGSPPFCKSLWERISGTGPIGWISMKGIRIVCLRFYKSGQYTPNVWRRG